jgi:hypothetical protein
LINLLCGVQEDKPDRIYYWSLMEVDTEPPGASQGSHVPLRKNLFPDVAVALISFNTAWIAEVHCVQPICDWPWLMVFVHSDVGSSHN